MSDSIQTIETAAGPLTLQSVEMSLTYGGYLEGVPSRELNDDHLRRKLKWVKSRWGHHPVHLVEPARTIPEDGEPHARYGPLELLPPVECVGLFRGRATPRAVGDWMFTGLVVLWHQERGDSLIHSEAAERLRDIPWDDLAKDFTFDDL